MKLPKVDFEKDMTCDEKIEKLKELQKCEDELEDKLEHLKDIRTEIENQGLIKKEKLDKLLERSPEVRASKYDSKLLEYIKESFNRLRSKRVLTEVTIRNENKFVTLYNSGWGTVPSWRKESPSSLVERLDSYKEIFQHPELKEHIYKDKLKEAFDLFADIFDKWDKGNTSLNDDIDDISRKFKEMEMLLPSFSGYNVKKVDAVILKKERTYSRNINFPYDTIILKHKGERVYRKQLRSTWRLSNDNNPWKVLLYQLWNVLEDRLDSIIEDTEKEEKRKIKLLRKVRKKTATLRMIDKLK